MNNYFRLKKEDLHSARGRVKIAFYVLLSIGVGSVVSGFLLENLGLIFGGLVFSILALNGIYANRDR